MNQGSANVAPFRQGSDAGQAERPSLVTELELIHKRMSCLQQEIEGMSNTIYAQAEKLFGPMPATGTGPAPDGLVRRIDAAGPCNLGSAMNNLATAVAGLRVSCSALRL